MTGDEFELYWPTVLSDQDREQLLELYDEVACHEATHGYLGSLGDERGRCIVAADAESLATGRTHMLLARDGSGLVGSVILERYASPARNHTLHAKRAVIARRARGRLLRRAVAEVLDKSASLRVDVVTCDVAADGPVDLWQSLGFRVFGVLPDYARRNGRALAGYFLYLPLTWPCALSATQPAPA